MTTPAQTPPTAPLPPQNLDAEEAILGAIMLSPRAIDTVAEIITPGDFYRDTHAVIYRTAVELHAQGESVDALTLADQLDKKQKLDQIGGVDKIRDIAAMTPAVSNVAHYARVVADMAALRSLIAAGQDIARLGWERPGEIPELVATAQRLADGLETRAVEDLQPLWWNEAIAEKLPETSEYVDGVLQTGVLADIVGLPYLHKTAVALELARKVAAGKGDLLGKHPVRQQANVAYFWSDDSRVKELERIQAYAAACDQQTVPIAFYLNSGLLLPDGIPTLKKQIRRHDFRLVLLDSLYNFAPGIDWVKDTGAVGALYAALKKLCDDIDGLTIVLVDHAAKPSDSNRGRDASVSSYGSVWKAAAVRCSIVITKDAGSLYVQAVGNNVKGFPKTPVMFDDEALELRVVETKEPDPEIEDRLRQQILDHVQAHPNCSTNDVVKNVKGRGNRVRSMLEQLAEEGAIANAVAPLDPSELRPNGSGTNPDEVRDNNPSQLRPEGSGRSTRKAQWIPLNHAVQLRPEHNGTKRDEVLPDQGSPLRPETSSRWPSPLGEAKGRSSGREEPTTADPDEDDWSSLAP